MVCCQLSETQLQSNSSILFSSSKYQSWIRVGIKNLRNIMFQQQPINQNFQWP
jgi:hypothetical protein